MDIKKCATATIVGFIAMFLLSGLWYLLIMDSFYASHSYIPDREPPMMVYIALGYFVLALLMAYIYPKGYSGTSPVKEGLKLGIIIAILWVLPLSLVLYGVKNMGTRVLILVDTIWHLVEQGVGGIVIGLAYGRKSESTEIVAEEESTEETSEEEAG